MDAMSSRKTLRRGRDAVADMVMPSECVKRLESMQ